MAMLPIATSMAAQTEQFSIATLNVDGLPNKVLFLNVNADGPGNDGSRRIGKYLDQKSYDLVFMQEDFNYHCELTQAMKQSYRFDKWSGGISLLAKKIDFMHLQNLRFDCDGLGAAWKKDVKAKNVSRTAWTDVFGKFSHANDELATKGFRRYEIVMPSGLELVVYNMHMDAGDDPDELTGNDTRDRQARQGEWQQLLDDLLPQLDNRPVLVVGDLNSYYCRDHIEERFIGAINATGLAKAGDVWVELENGGVYPEPIEGIVYSEQQGFELNGETLDKIIYINPTEGPQLKPIAYTRDIDGYLYNGKALGDHFPIAATFQVTGHTQTVGQYTSGLTIVETDQQASRQLFDLSGRQMKGQTNRGLYIERNGKDTRKRIIK